MDKLKRVSTRDIAKSLGHKKYKVQWPCVICRGKWRYTSNRQCVSCLKNKLKKEVDDRMKKEDTT